MGLALRLATALALACSLIAAAAASKTPSLEAKSPTRQGVPSLKDFYDDPALTGARLSPSGRYLAIVQNDAVAAVTVTDLETNKTVKVMNLGVGRVATRGLSVSWLGWKGDRRLLIGLNLFNVRRRGNLILGGEIGNFVVAIDRDGQNMHQLLGGPMVAGQLGLLDLLPKDPVNVLLTSPATNRFSGVRRVNVFTGESELIEVGDYDVVGWGTDSDGAIVERIRADGKTKVVEGRAPGETQWTLIAQLHPKDLKQFEDFQIFGPAEKPGQLYVAVNPTGQGQGDTRTVRVFDLASRSLGPPIWPAGKYDVDDILYDGDSFKLAGACHIADVSECVFNDPTVASKYSTILDYFGHKRNITVLSMVSRFWLLLVEGPDEPAAYYIFDGQTHTLRLVGRCYPKLLPDQLADVDIWSYTARDGAAIPGYLTHPKNAGAAPLPLIVLPHGGPEVRDAYGYDRWAQYLATRGYLVFQPNFRGSGGFGRAWGAAGYRQWGGRMADDVTDGVRKLIDTGRADRARICIFGASFGGYAALYAGATHPELYKCVVSWAGISDQAALLKFERSFGAGSGRYKYWLQSIGDPAQDGALIAAQSPVTYASEYKPAVLLIHGSDDHTVPVQQSYEMERALRARGKDVSLSIYKEQDHSGWDQDKESDALSRVGAFIQSHIPPAVTTRP